MRVPAIVGVIGEENSDIPNNDFEEIHLDLIRCARASQRGAIDCAGTPSE